MLKQQKEKRRDYFKGKFYSFIKSKISDEKVKNKKGATKK